MNNTNDRKKNMRQGSGGRRGRGRHHNNGNNNRGGRSVTNLRHQSFDSNGPDVRVRGNARQVYEKYQSLARDAMSAGDTTMAESYLQHAEHYYRITEAIEDAAKAEQRKREVATSNKQPETPSNYFTPEGKVPQDSKPAAKTSAPTADSKKDEPKARKRTRSAPAPKPAAAADKKEESEPSSSPFFSLDEAEEDTGSQPQKLVAQ